MSNVPTPADEFGDDHPMIAEAIEALTFCGQLDVDEIPRERAARLLSIWARRPKLTPAEVEAILAHFPETVPDAEEQDVDEQVTEAFRLGLRIGKTLGGYACGYVNAFSSQHDDRVQLVDDAEASLRRVAGEVERGEAAQILRMLAIDKELSRAERGQVLARFPERLAPERLYRGAPDAHGRTPGCPPDAAEHDHSRWLDPRG